MDPMSVRKVLRALIPMPAIMMTGLLSTALRYPPLEKDIRGFVFSFFLYSLVNLAVTTMLFTRMMKREKGPADAGTGAGGARM